MREVWTEVGELAQHVDGLLVAAVCRLKQQEVHVQWQVLLHSHRVAHLGLLEEVKVQLEEPEDLLVVVGVDGAGFGEWNGKRLQAAQSKGDGGGRGSAKQAGGEVATVDHAEMAEREHDPLSLHETAQKTCNTEKKTPKSTLQVLYHL